MNEQHGDARVVEGLCRTLLHNAAARRQAVVQAEPDYPSVDYRTGFAAGKEAGEVAAMALVLGAITGESSTALVEHSVVQAAVDAVFPFDLHVVASDGAGSGGEST